MERHRWHPTHCRTLPSGALSDSAGLKPFGLVQQEGLRSSSRMA
jgi:hypothetical protein